MRQAGSILTLFLVLVLSSCGGSSISTPTPAPTPTPPPAPISGTRRDIDLDGGKQYDQCAQQSQRRCRRQHGRVWRFGRRRCRQYSGQQGWFRVLDGQGRQPMAVLEGMRSMLPEDWDCSTISGSSILPTMNGLGRAGATSSISAHVLATSVHTGHQAFMARWVPLPPTMFQEGGNRRSVGLTATAICGSLEEMAVLALEPKAL